MEKNDFTAQVLMVGGRRCGKTSILAAMKDNFEEIFKQTGMTMYMGDFDTLDALIQKSNEMKDYFIGINNRMFVPDSNPTEEEKTYSFRINLVGKNSDIIVKFVDYPGEWMTAKNHRETLLKHMKLSRAIIVAIDTPHMMEEEGRFNEYRNFCRRTGEMLKMALSDKGISWQKKLILFVPLKCERYLEERKMEEVCAKTKESYKELIYFLQNAKMKYEVAITPIFTMGGAMFSHFERDNLTKEIIVNREFHTPEKAIYYFPDVTIKEPTPKYCEQPIVYLMRYIAEMIEERKRNEYNGANIFGKLGIKIGEKFFDMASINDYLEYKELIKQRIKKDGDGYHIIQNPMGF